jgi:predicted transcriptional regulator
MKTAISLPDDLFREAEALAERTGKSRSQIYREALAEYLGRREPSAITAALNEVVADVDGEPDEWLAQTARQVLEQSEW